MSDETQHSRPPADAGDATVSRPPDRDTSAEADPAGTAAGSAGSVNVGATATRPAVPGFELVKELGRGAMGVVFQARQVGLNRLVALKMLLAGEYADPGARARFPLEAEAVAALEHPHVIRVFAFGEHAGHPYLAMEFLSGGTLADRLRAGGPLPPHEAAALVAKLAAAVGHAHARGVVHRDIKPANVLLGADGEPRLSDFGLAKVGGSELTGTGAVLGTPAYMAPEQAAGKRAVGPPADVYALGAVLYDLLTGKPPFRGDSVMETLQLVLTAEPGRPRQLNPAVPRDLETICLKCLAKDAAARYASADALAADLGRFARGEPILARRAGAAERAGRWVRRHRAAVAVSALVLGLVVALAVVASRPDPHAGATAGPAAPPHPPPVPAPPATDELLAVVEELDRADPGWRLEQIDKARRVVPPLENSAATVDLVVAALPAGFDQQLAAFLQSSDSLPPTAPVPKNLRPDGRGLLKAQLAALRLANQPYGRFPLNWDRAAFSSQLPHAQRPRAAAGLLRWGAASAASGGDGGAGLTHCRACVNAGRALHDEPASVSQLVRIACGTTGARAAGHVLALSEAPDRELAALAATLRDEDAAPVLAVIARAERAMAHRAFSVVAAGDVLEFPPGTDPDEVATFERIPKGPAARVAHVWALRHYGRLLEITKRPPHEQAAPLAAWGATVRNEAPPGAKEIVVAADKLGAACRRYSATVRTALAGVALERYRLANGHWPERLADLVPEYLSAVPLDPEDGARLRFRALPDGVVVYGVGTDLKDDGGDLSPPAKDEQPRDIGFRLWTPERRGKG